MVLTQTRQLSLSVAIFTNAAWQRKGREPHWRVNGCLGVTFSMPLWSFSTVGPLNAIGFQRRPRRHGTWRQRLQGNMRKLLSMIKEELLTRRFSPAFLGSLRFRGPWIDHGSKFLCQCCSLLVCVHVLSHLSLCLLGTCFHGSLSLS